MFEGVELRQFDLETGSHKLQSGEKYGGSTPQARDHRLRRVLEEYPSQISLGWVLDAAKPNLGQLISRRFFACKVVVCILC